MYPVDKCTIYTRQEVLPDVERAPRLENIRRSPGNPHDAAAHAKLTQQRSGSMAESTSDHLSPSQWQAMLQQSQFGHPYQQLRRLWKPQRWSAGLDVTARIILVLDGAHLEEGHGLEFAMLLCTHFHMALEIQVHCADGAIDVAAVRAALIHHAPSAQRLVAHAHIIVVATRDRTASLQASCEHATPALVIRGDILHSMWPALTSQFLEQLTGAVLMSANAPLHQGIQRILIPADGTPTSHVALSYGIVLAEALGAALDVLHVAPEDSPRHRAFHQAMQHVQWKHVERQYMTKQGSVAQTITECALQHDADLIVMGTSQRGPESICLRTLHIARTAVLVMPHT